MNDRDTLYCYASTKQTTKSSLDENIIKSKNLNQVRYLLFHFIFLLICSINNHSSFALLALSSVNNRNHFIYNKLPSSQRHSIYMQQHARNIIVNRRTRKKIYCLGRLLSNKELSFNSRLMSSTIAQTSLLSSSSDNNEKEPLVIIISGPTGIGKSSLAYKLCSPNESSKLHEHDIGHIVNADSVQVYKDVQIGANKPTKQELEAVQHHVIDMLSPMNDSYSAADWMNDTTTVLNVLTGHNHTNNDIEQEMTNDSKNMIGSKNERQKQIIKNAENSLVQDKNNNNTTRKILPIVVGGTMMYIQWLVHGRPDAMKPTTEAVQKSRELIQKFQSVLDETQGWEEAVTYIHQNLPPLFYKRIQQIFCGKDWYRLGRLLEVAFTMQDTDDNDKLEQILYTGERSFSLSSLGYDVRCFFICPTNRYQHAHILNTRCEEMILQGLLTETTQLLLQQEGTTLLNKQILNSIGYRQTIDYLQRNNPKSLDMKSFDLFIDQFMTSTRQYAKKQMQWFRKDADFLFLPVDTNMDDDDKSNNKKNRLDDSLNGIIHLCSLSRKEYDEHLKLQQHENEYDNISNTTTELLSSFQLKQLNEVQGKGMRTFLPKRNLLVKGSDVYNDMLRAADDCTKIVQGLDSLE